MRGRLEGWVFGCDVCQEVCPFNRRSGRACPPVLSDLAPRPLPDDAERLARMEPAEFRTAFAGTAVMRTGAAGMRRNARLALERAAGESEKAQIE